MKITKSRRRVRDKIFPSALRRSKRVLQKRDLLTNLPHDITRKILGRFPIRCIMRFKFVCKSWRDLIEGGDFAFSYAPEPGFAFVHGAAGYAVCDEACEPLCRFGLPPPHGRGPTHTRSVVGSANGLLLVWDGRDDGRFVCNPITREYIKLPQLRTRSCVSGFGVSKVSGQYKILCGDRFRSYHVYTLGRERGCWRSIAVAAACSPRLPPDNAVFFNGNLHWLASDLKEKPLVCCFDLETELFTRFSLPPREYGNNPETYWFSGGGEYQLCVLDGRLCVCDILKFRPAVVWWMNNYGDAFSWVKAYTIKRPKNCEAVFPLKVLANGDLLFAVSTFNQLYIYNKNTKRIAKNGVLRRSHHYFYNIVTYIPSFLSLKAMEIRNVKSLSFY